MAKITRAILEDRFERAYYGEKIAEDSQGLRRDVGERFDHLTGTVRELLMEVLSGDSIPSFLIDDGPYPVVQLEGEVSEFIRARVIAWAEREDELWGAYRAVLAKERKAS